MALIMTVTGVLGVAAVYCWKGRLCPGEHARQRHIIEVCLVLLQLIQEAQRHRGLSTAIINGEKAFLDELFTTEKVIHLSLNNMSEYYADRYRIFSRDQWLALLYKWKSLRRSWRDLDFIPNLFAHNELIIELINVLQQLAEDETQRLGKHRAQLIMHWPLFIEHLGMLRALGVYALSQQSPTGLMNISLTMAEHKQQARQVLSHETEGIMDKLLIENSERALRQVDDLLAEGMPGLSVKSFYEDMTCLIDSWYMLLNRQMYQ